MDLNNYLARNIHTERLDDVFGIEFHNGWEARDARQAAEQAALSGERPSIARRTLAHGFAVVSRGSAVAARRLDDVVADDLRRALAPGK